MKENINALDEISKGAHMGMDAINDILDKIEDKTFKKVIKKQYDNYKKIAEKIEKLYKKYNSEDDPHKTSLLNKVMTKSGIDMRTLNDKSTSKIAELLLQGTNMGIIEGRKILNKKEITSDVNNIISEYVTMQEKCVEVLKKYL